MRISYHCALALLLHHEQFCNAFMYGRSMHLPVKLVSASHIKQQPALVSESKSTQKLALEEMIIRNNETLEVLSHDPLVYLVHDVLSPSECQSYIDRIINLSEEEGNTRGMRTSNPPQVSLVVTKLWPLPFLSILAGIPKFIRQLDESGGASKIIWTHVFVNVAPTILVALILSSTLALVSVPLLQAIVAPASRTSEVVALNQEADMQFIQKLVERACRITNGHPWMCFEAPVITKYKSGAVFAMHNDASPTRGSEWSELGGQRVATTIFYLNSCIVGGATYFDRLGIAVQPRQGSALVFFPSDKGTLEADERTRHESMPAVEEKWIVQMFGRIGPRVPPPLGIPDKFKDHSFSC